jgi:hypothetical protein
MEETIYVENKNYDKFHNMDFSGKRKQEFFGLATKTRNNNGH